MFYIEMLACEYLHLDFDAVNGFSLFQWLIITIINSSSWN